MRGEELILIVYSVRGTDEVDINRFIDASGSYEGRVTRTRFNAPSRVRAEKFEVPAGTSPGEMLPTELFSRMSQCVGAIVFVDDVRPNIAYELGFFHGRGCRVLLVCKTKSIGEVWSSFSDLAGCPLLTLQDSTDVVAETDRYLARVYDHLGTGSPWPLMRLPHDAENQLDREFVLPPQDRIALDNGPFGRLLRWATWSPCDMAVRRNILPDAQFCAAMRSASLDTSPTVQPIVDYAVYFDIRYRTSDGRQHNIWVAVASWKSDTAVHGDERTLPGFALSDAWQVLAGGFDILMERCSVYGSAERLERVRFRAGPQDPARRLPEVPPSQFDPGRAVELGFIRISGLL